MEFIFKILMGLALGVVGMPVGVADFNNPTRHYENVVMPWVVIKHSSCEVANVNVRPDSSVLNPAIDNGFLPLRWWVESGDVYRRIGGNDRPALLGIGGYPVASWFCPDLNHFAGCSASIANLNRNAKAAIASHFTNVPADCVQDCALGFNKGLSAGFGVDRSTARIEGGGDGRAQGEATNYATDIAEQPGGVRSALRSVRSLPLGAQVGGTIILSLIAGLCACVGGVRFMQGRWGASATACGTGLLVLTALTFVAWASS